MIELGFVNLLRTVLTLVIIYYVVRFLLRWWIKRKVSALHKERQNSVSEEEATFKRNEKGKVHIKTNQSSSKSTSSSGEYVDYEEVE